MDLHVDSLSTMRGAAGAATLALGLLLSGCGGGSATTTTSSGTAGTIASARPLSAAAQLGELIFRDPSLSGSGRMACASCHDPQRGHASPFDTPVAMGGPNLDQPGLRNPPSLRATRTDLAARTDLCGAFKVPSLRTVGLRKRFFHNGNFDSLEQAVRFYVRRDTDPQLWYPTDALGNVIPYSDMPADLRGNVNTTEGPYNARAGEAPALTDSEVDDLASFLRTLTDGYAP